MNDDVVRRLSYCSRSKVPMLRSRAELEKIIQVSQPRNAALGVTGALTLVQDLYYQVLEGPSDAIDELMTRIGRDSRHDGLRIVEDTSDGPRIFRNWSMRFALPRTNDRDVAYALLSNMLNDRSHDNGEMLGLLREWTDAFPASVR